MDNRSRVTAAGTLIAAVVSWALAPVFIRFLSGAYDPYSQAFVRYVSGAVCLTAVSWIGFRGEFVRLLRHPGMLLGIACLNTFQQCTWTMGTYDATATMAQLITKLNVVLVIVLSFFLFREERGIIRNPAYLGGTALSLVGVTAVLAKEPG
ncbi:MAG: DMT family transporter, partial [Candidatus Hydrogenedentes bacterium]|nr:DMT family transporter [Candidatus Hydrogenedentota bacterium]